MFLQRWVFTKYKYFVMPPRSNFLFTPFIFKNRLVTLVLMHSRGIINYLYFVSLYAVFQRSQD